MDAQVAEWRATHLGLGVHTFVLGFHTCRLESHVLRLGAHNVARGCPRLVGFGCPRCECERPHSGVESHVYYVRTHFGHVWTPENARKLPALRVHTPPPLTTLGSDLLCAVGPRVALHAHLLRPECPTWTHVFCVQVHVFCVSVHLCPACCVEARIFARGCVWVPTRAIYVRPRIGQQKIPSPKGGEDLMSEGLTLRVTWLFSLTSWRSSFAPLEQPQRLACLFELRSKPPRQRSSLALARLCRECYVPCSRLHRPTWFSAR